MWLGCEHKIEDLPWLQLVRKADYFWDREEELNNCSQERLWSFWFSKDRPGDDYGENLGVCGTDIKCTVNYNPFLVHRLPRLPLTRSSFVHEILHLITPNYILWKGRLQKMQREQCGWKIPLLLLFLLIAESYSWIWLQHLSLSIPNTVFYSLQSLFSERRGRMSHCSKHRRGAAPHCFRLAFLLPPSLSGPWYYVSIAPVSALQLWSC